jgi:hypothetical protein
MHTTSARFLFLLVSSVGYFQASADRIEKKGTILNSSCNPIGTRCPADAAGNKIEVTLTYVCHEPRQGSFRLEFREHEVMQYAILTTAFKGKSTLTLSEEMPIPPDVLQLLQWSGKGSIPSGNYPIEYRNGIYTVVIRP